MKFTKLFAALMIAGAVMSCTTKTEKTDADAAAVEVAEAPAALDAPEIEADAVATKFISDFYQNYVFSDAQGNFEDIKDNFSEKILKELRDKYDFDGEGYAVWIFRSDAQDGPEDKQIVENISIDGDGWYTATLNDMGNPTGCRFHITVDNGKVLVSDFEKVSL